MKHKACALCANKLETRETKKRPKIPRQLRTNRIFASANSTFTARTNFRSSLLFVPTMASADMSSAGISDSEPGAFEVSGNGQSNSPQWEQPHSPLGNQIQGTQSSQMQRTYDWLRHLQCPGRASSRSGIDDPFDEVDLDDSLEEDFDSDNAASSSAKSTRHERVSLARVAEDYFVSPECIENLTTKVRTKVSPSPPPEAVVAPHPLCLFILVSCDLYRRTVAIPVLNQVQRQLDMLSNPLPTTLSGGVVQDQRSVICLRWFPRGSLGLQRRLVAGLCSDLGLDLLDLSSASLFRPSVELQVFDRFSVWGQ